ncbi:hypothetical protein D3C71_502850 [compost metagenome]
MKLQGKILTHSFAIIGGLLLLGSAFLQFESKQDFIGNSEEIKTTYTYGLTNPLWYLILICTTIIFSIGYFTQGLAFRILVYIFSFLCSIFIYFVTLLTGVGWGATPFIPQKEIGFVLSIFGYIIIIIATIISMYTKKKKSSGDTSDLLDEV